MWQGNFIAGARIKGYDTLLKGDNKIPKYDADKTKDKGVSELNFLNKTAYNNLILAQEDMVSFISFKKRRQNLISMKT